MRDTRYFTTHDPLLLLRLDTHLEQSDLSLIRSNLLAEIAQRIRNHLPPNELQHAIKQLAHTYVLTPPLATPQIINTIASVHQEFLISYIEELCADEAEKPPIVADLHNLLTQSIVDHSAVHNAITNLYSFLSHQP